MFDQVLTSILQIVIVVDILGVIAYFVLAGLRPKQADSGASESPSLSSYLPWRRRCNLQPVRATATEFDQLRQVLYGFRSGLA
tara:strand:- start:574 stop:822 length:249 start_codon:yes stop_codon:yes gene_type:complete